jgi:hypothetical protein
MTVSVRYMTFKVINRLQESIMIVDNLQRIQSFDGR